MKRLQRRFLGLHIALWAALLVWIPSRGAEAQAKSLLDGPPAVYEWKVPPSATAPMIERSLQRADEILRNVLVPDAPLMVTEMACGQPDMAYSLSTRTIMLCREFVSFVATLSEGRRRD